MTTVIFEYNGKSKEIPINEIKSVNDVADAYSELGLKTKRTKSFNFLLSSRAIRLNKSYCLSVTSIVNFLDMINCESKVNKRKRFEKFPNLLE